MAKKPSTPGLPSQRQLRAGEIIRHALADVNDTCVFTHADHEVFFHRWGDLLAQS